MEDTLARRVCVIGTGIRDQLFGEPEASGREVIPVGETIVINGQPFAIIGMFAHYEGEQDAKERQKPAAERRRQPQFVFQIKNNTIYIPLGTMLATFRSGAGADGGPDPRLTTLNATVADRSLLEGALQQMRNVLLLRHHGIEDFAFRTQEEEAEAIQTAIGNAQLSGNLIAALALLAGGIGISNIMLAGIAARLREIGIRKSVGATSGQIFCELISESVAISGLGGFIGIGASFLLVDAIGWLTPAENTPLITFSAIVTGLLAAVLTGVMAGFIPALRASRLSPVEALQAR